MRSLKKHSPKERELFYGNSHKDTQRNDVVDFSGVFVFFTADLTFIVKTLSQAFYTCSVRSVMLYRKVMTHPFVFRHLMTFFHKSLPFERTCKPYRLTLRIISRPRNESRVQIRRGLNVLS